MAGMNDAPTPKQLPEAQTPLLAILRALGTPERRDEFAQLAGTSKGYLYQLAICSRKRCNSGLAMRIQEASRVVHKKYQCGTIDMMTLATMCTNC
ncbi:hypothetical protein Acf1_00017 [Acidovorax phage ACF1]|nr:hypothetical protein Acf1_00017 [Acidovorax phage ACF1]